MLSCMQSSSFCLRLRSFNQDFRPFYSFGKRLWQTRHAVRLLHIQQNVGAFSTGRQDLPHFEGSNPYADKQTTFVKKKVEDNKDIIINDLSATLQAHRNTNRSRIIRKFFQTRTPHSEGSNQHADEEKTVVNEKVVKKAVKRAAKKAARKAAKKAGKEAGKEAGDNQAIIINDSSTTLEAPRDTKRTGVIRKMPSGQHSDPSSSDSEVNLDYTQTAPLNTETAVLGARTTSQSDTAAYQDTSKDLQKTIKQKRREKLLQKRLAREADRIGSLYSDYEGVARGPRGRWKTGALKGIKQSPWLSLLTDIEGDGLARLKNEIKAYEKYMSLTPYDIVAASSVLRDVKSIVKESDPSASVDLLGSYCSGLASATSNLDLRLSHPSLLKYPLSRGPSPGGKVSRNTGLKSLHKLAAALSKSKSFSDVQMKWGRIDILDALHCPTKITVQVQFAPTPPASSQYIATYLSEFPTLRPLFILLRSALRIRGLNDVLNGGLGSYTILIMIVYALNASELPRHDIAAQLLYILKLYSEADLYKYGFSPDPPRMFDKSMVGMEGNSTARLYGIDVMQKYKYQGPFQLCLQDPADSSQDLGCKSYAIKHVQAVFRSARQRIEIAMREWEAMTESERQNVKNGCLDPLVRALYTSFEERRTRVKKTVGQAEELNQDLLDEWFLKTRMFERPLGDFLTDRDQKSNPTWSRLIKTSSMSGSRE